MILVCLVCGKEFKSSNAGRKTCGLDCGDKWRKQNSKPIIEGKRECGSCHQYKPLTEYYYRGDTPRAWCKVCDNKYIIVRQNARKKEFVNLKGGKCQKCGYDRCKGALEFHHIDKSTKEFGINRNFSLERAQEELDKCILLCANCHREEHTKVENW